MIRLFLQGYEEILYGPLEGNTLIDYYLIACLEGNHVMAPPIAFAYSAEHDVYFLLNEGDRLVALRTFQEVDDYVVASFFAPDVECIVSLEEMLPEPYKEVWLKLHRNLYRWMYE